MNFNLLIMLKFGESGESPTQPTKKFNFYPSEMGTLFVPHEFLSPNLPKLNGQPTKPVRDGMVLENQWSIQIPGSSAKGTNKTQHYSL